MFNLDALYDGHKEHGTNPLCEGCSILKKSKPCHSVMDYEGLRESPVLFLSDSLSYRQGSAHAFPGQEYNLIKSSYPESFVAAASVKCPSVKDADMNKDDRNLCRAHLEATIDKVKPKLIFTCGNLSMKMLLKKSGVISKRGKSFPFTTVNGHSCTVVPLYHPYSCIVEPSHTTLFKKDIDNAYHKYVLCKRDESNFNYKVLMNIEEVFELAALLRDSTEDLAVDIETTGFNFRTDKLQTISISSRDETWVIPVDHKDSPFIGKQSLLDLLMIILGSPARKIFHNAKFDLKFLLAKGIKVNNPWDTKLMHHVLDENMPGGLMDLVKLYFAGELENL